MDTQIFLLTLLALFQKTQGNALAINNPKFSTTSFCECGLENLRSKIVGGKEVKTYRYSWMAVIYDKKKLTCGGALINSLYILTAAHCLDGKNKKNVEAYLSVHDRTTIKQKLLSDFQKVGIEKLIIHSDYNPRKRGPDLGLIKMIREFNPDKFTPICLPEKDEDYTHKITTSIGWGRTAEGRSVSQKLLEVNLTVISMEDCIADYYVGDYVQSSMLCTLEKDKDACQGDSGGPLMYARKIRNEKKSPRWEQIGIVSWGIGCAREGQPGVYARVASFLDWISNNTRDATYCKHPEE